MKIYSLIVFLSLSFSCADLLSAPTLIILDNGGNLPSAIASAPHGAVIELRSNGVFSGNLSWEDKFLTIQAGLGFQPLIQGSILGIDGNSQTGGVFRGLNISGGFTARANSTTFATYEIEDTTIQGNVSISGTGDFKVNMLSRDSLFMGSTRVGGTGGFSFDGLFERNIFMDTATVSTMANDQIHQVDFNDNEFLARFISTGGGCCNRSRRDLEFNRNRFRQGLLIAMATFNTLDFNIADNVFGSFEPGSMADDDTGFELRANAGTALIVTGKFVNNTVVGFSTGIDVNIPDSTNFPPDVDLEFANLLLSNVDDLKNVDLNDISFSLVSDGTYAGINGNFTGQPILGLNGQLLATSPGIDRGNNAKAGNVDFAGNTRILDGDGSGIAVVDVGAYEFVVPEPSSLGLATLCCLTCAILRRH